MQLKECFIGDYVSIWCIGTLGWDNDIAKIIEKGILITVQYKNGYIKRFVPEAECKKINF